MEDDPLFEVSLKSFVDERKLLAASLRAAKRADAVKRVLAMPKPTPGAWALNQIARKESAVLAAYLEAHDAQAAAQVQGAGREQMFATAHAERAAKKALVDCAVKLLEADGQKASKTVLDALPTTLHATAMDPSQRAVLVAGRLLKDVDAADFSTLALLAASQGLAPEAVQAPFVAPPDAAPVPAALVTATAPVKLVAVPTPVLVAGETEAHEAKEREAKGREVKEREAKEREAKERISKLVEAVDSLRIKREQIAGTLRGARSDLVTAQATLAAARLFVAKTEEAVATSEAALLTIEAECDDASEALASAR